MTDVFIYDHVRTPRGRGKKDGSLHEVPSVRLAAKTLEAIRDRNGLDTSAVDDIIMGCVDPVMDAGAVIPKAAAFAITNPASALAQSPALEQLPDPNGTIATYSIDWGLVRGMVANNYQSSGQAPFPLQRARLYPGGRQVITLDAYDNTKIASDG